MRRAVFALPAAALLLWAAGGVMAACWEKVGTSGFTTSISLLQDYQRLVYNSIVVDEAGNIYATANNKQNGNYVYTTPAGPPYLPVSNTISYDARPGGLTIFKPDSSKIDVQVSSTTDPSWSAFRWATDLDIATYGGRTDNRLVGAITKLVVAGDGKVYGLMNYNYIQWDLINFSLTDYCQNHRIVRIDADGTVTPIWTPPDPRVNPAEPATGARYYIREGTDPDYAYRWSSVGDETSNGVRNMIRSITVGGDGNVYWIMAGTHNYWKRHLLWRYNVSSETVEESPTAGTNNGWLDAERAFIFEYAGDEADSGEPMFAIICQMYDPGSGAPISTGWELTWMTWTQSRDECYTFDDETQQYVLDEDAFHDPGWGRDYITATAYDPTHRWLWLCGRGISNWMGSTNIYTQFTGYNLDPPTNCLFRKLEAGRYDIRDHRSRHANGNDTGSGNGGLYWISALAIDPGSGEGWMAFTGQADYNYEPAGTVVTRDLSNHMGNEGIPEANAYTVGLAFKGDTCYALVCNKGTGAYSVYKTVPTNIGTMKLEQPGSLVLTDTEKVVTYSDYTNLFFYMQEDDRSSGIKVLPEPAIGIPFPGNRVAVRGPIDTLNGEAVIYADRVDAEWATDVVDPLCLQAGKVGGKLLGLQPDTYAYDPRRTPTSAVPETLNTTGLVVRAVGKVFGSVPYTGFYLDDGSQYGVWVNHTDDVVDDDSVVGITGVSTVAWDEVNQIGVRAIQALPAPELMIYQAAP